MSKKSHLILALIFLYCCSVLAKYSGGSGEPNAPYLIATPNDLNSIGLDPCDWSKHFLMTADINMAQITGTQYNQIGTGQDNYFSGIFDGNSHTIYNFTYDSLDTDYVGIFGYVLGENARIENLTLRDVNIVGDYYVGALAGKVKGSVINCAVIGGCISGELHVGGLTGMSHCFEHKDGCNGIISGCYAKVYVTGRSAVGGLVGSNYANIDSCFTTGKVTGVDYVGGLTGINADLGGANVSNSYSLANVQGHSLVGGFIGDLRLQSDKIIKNCFSAGAVDGNNSTGAFIGEIEDNIYLSCFWDASINPDINGISDGSDPNVIGLPTVQMQQRQTFTEAGWDMLNIWDIGENQTYPFLRTHPPSDINKDDQTNLLDLAILAQNWLKEE